MRAGITTVGVDRGTPRLDTPSAALLSSSTPPPIRCARGNAPGMLMLTLVDDTERARRPSETGRASSPAVGDPRPRSPGARRHARKPRPAPRIPGGARGGARLRACDPNQATRCSGRSNRWGSPSSRRGASRASSWENIGRDRAARKNRGRARASGQSREIAVQSRDRQRTRGNLALAGAPVLLQAGRLEDRGSLGSARGRRGRTTGARRPHVLPGRCAVRTGSLGRGGNP